MNNFSRRKMQDEDVPAALALLDLAIDMLATRSADTDRVIGESRRRMISDGTLDPSYGWLLYELITNQPEMDCDHYEIESKLDAMVALRRRLERR